MQALLLSFLMREVLLVVGVVMEVLDYTSDLLVFVKVLSQASDPKVQPLVIPYCNPLLQSPNELGLDSTATASRALLTVCFARCVLQHRNARFRFQAFVLFPQNSDDKSSCRSFAGD